MLIPAFFCSPTLGSERQNLGNNFAPSLSNAENQNNLYPSKPSEKDSKERPEIEKSQLELAIEACMTEDSFPPYFNAHANDLMFQKINETINAFYKTLPDLSYQENAFLRYVNNDQHIEAYTVASNLIRPGIYAQAKNDQRFFAAFAELSIPYPARYNDRKKGYFLKELIGFADALPQEKFRNKMRKHYLDIFQAEAVILNLHVTCPICSKCPNDDDCLSCQDAAYFAFYGITGEILEYLDLPLLQKSLEACYAIYHEPVENTEYSLADTKDVLCKKHR